jgi:hypothetical protein
MAVPLANSLLWAMHTDEGRLLELEGSLHLDVFRQKRLIVNGVSLTLKRLQSTYEGKIDHSDVGVFGDGLS